MSEEAGRLEGTDLAVVTALMSGRGATAESLSALVPQGSDEVRDALRRLGERGLATADARGVHRLSVDGLAGFYRTLGQVRDALAPSRLTPSLPFTVETTWRECLCFNYLVEPEALRAVLPPVLEPVLKDGRGLLSVAAASLGNLRPRGLPEITGQSFCHVTYRVVASFENAAGQQHVGYDFAASLTNNRLMAKVGNSVTEFKFHRFDVGDISFLRRGQELVLGADSADPATKLVASVDLADASETPVQATAFRDRAELDALVIDHADAFGCPPGADHVYVLTIDRDPWRYRFLPPRNLYLGYVDGHPIAAKDAVLDSVLHCSNVGYRWQPLKREALAR